MKPHIMRANGMWACFVGREGWLGLTPKLAYSVAMYAVANRAPGWNKCDLFDCRSEITG